MTFYIRQHFDGRYYASTNSNPNGFGTSYYLTEEGLQQYNPLYFKSIEKAAEHIQKLYPNANTVQDMW